MSKTSIELSIYTCIPREHTFVQQSLHITSEHVVFWLYFLGETQKLNYTFCCEFLRGMVREEAFKATGKSLIQRRMPTSSNPAANWSRKHFPRRRASCRIISWATAFLFVNCMCGVIIYYMPGLLTLPNADNISL